MITDKNKIKDWLHSVGINEFEITPENTVNVMGDVNLAESKSLLGSFPIQFGHIHGSFILNDNKMTILIGSPHTVEKNFIGFNNYLKSLEHGPKIVKGDFIMAQNLLTSLEHMPDVGHHILLTDNNLTSLQYLPSIVHGSLYCSFNHLQSLEYAPKEIHGNFDCFGNFSMQENLQYLPQIITGFLNFHPDGEFPALEHLIDEKKPNQLYIEYTHFKNYLLNAKLEKDLIFNDTAIKKIKI